MQQKHDIKEIQFTIQKVKNKLSKQEFFLLG